MPNIQKTKIVVAAVIGDNQGKVLLTRRKTTQSLPGMWEFPGGKVEALESPEMALRRELIEEIALPCTIGPIWDVVHFVYPNFVLLMLVYPAKPIASASPRAMDVAACVYCAPKDLGLFSILQADEKLVTRLQTEGLPSYVRV